MSVRIEKIEDLRVRKNKIVSPFVHFQSVD